MACEKPRNIHYTWSSSLPTGLRPKPYLPQRRRTIRASNFSTWVVHKNHNYYRSHDLGRRGRNKSEGLHIFALQPYVIAWQMSITNDIFICICIFSFFRSKVDLDKNPPNFSEKVFLWSRNIFNFLFLIPL